MIPGSTINAAIWSLWRYRRIASTWFTARWRYTTCQGWLTDDNGERFWGVNHYQEEGQRVSNWLAEGVIKYHRTLGTTLNTLIRAGLTINEVNEWGPTQAQIDAWPALAEEAERPMLVLISARKA